MRWWKMGAFLAPRSISDNAGRTTTYKGWVWGCMREAHQNNPGHLLGNDKCNKRHDKPWPASIAGYLKVHEISWFGLGGRRLPVFPYFPYIFHIFPIYIYMILHYLHSQFNLLLTIYSHVFISSPFQHLLSPARIFLAAGWPQACADGTDLAQIGALRDPETAAPWWSKDGVNGCYMIVWYSLRIW